MSVFPVSLVSEPSKLLPMPWEALPAPKLPKDATSAQRKEYYAEREKANADHEISPNMTAHKKLRRRNDESDPAPGIDVCHKYLLAKYDDDAWLTKQLSVLIFANRALSIPIWNQYYSDDSEVQKVKNSLTVCVKTAVMSLREGGVDLERYFAQKTIESFHRSF